MKEYDIRILDRQGKRSAEKALNNLFRVKEISLAKFIGGFDIKNIGETIAEIVIDGGFDSLEKIRDANLSDLDKIDNIGLKSGKLIKTGIKTLYEDMLEVLSTNKISIKENEKKDILTDLTFCFTGKLETMSRNRAKEIVAKNGGKFRAGISKTLSYLVTNTPTSSSSKNKKANEYGIEIITEQEFLDLIK